MLKTVMTFAAVALVAAGTISCTTRSAATGASVSTYCDGMQTEAARVQCQLDERPRARSGGRAAGAGGSHAPGSTGSGHGTFGADSTAEIGSVR